jgi:adenylate kinase family enzyme
LAGRLGSPHVELDGIFHQPGWTTLGPDEFAARVRESTTSPSWVVDGNYSAVRDLVWQEADTVVWLDLPLTLVLVRIIGRTVGRVVRRTELWNGNREPYSNLWSLNPEKSIVAWAVSRHQILRRRYSEAMLDPRWSHLAFVQLRSPTQVDQFLKNAERFTRAEGVT